MMGTAPPANIQRNPIANGVMFQHFHRLRVHEAAEARVPDARLQEGGQQVGGIAWRAGTRIVSIVADHQRRSIGRMCGGAGSSLGGIEEMMALVLPMLPDVIRQ
jgi:hypothetical protein